MKKVFGLLLIISTTILLSGCRGNKDEGNKNNGNKNEQENIINSGQEIINNIPSYSIDTKQRGEFPGEDIYVNDANGNLILSLDDKNEPQYLFALYENYLIIDSGTSASQREMLVYDIPSGKVIYKTDYYPGENGLILNDNNITFYKTIDQSLYGEYSLPNCKNEYDNGYVESYGYTIGEDQANNLGNIQCAYFE